MHTYTQKYKHTYMQPYDAAIRTQTSTQTSTYRPNLSILGLFIGDCADGVSNYL